MIPILYDTGESLFTSNGIGRLRDMIACEVTEERNGVYECDFSYPVDGAHFDEIVPGRVIACTHDETGAVEPFDIVSYTKPISGVVSFHAVHISYRQRGLTVKGTGINTLTGAFTLLKNNATPENPFMYSADFSASGYMAAADGIPRSVRQMLGGVEGSILDTYGGEYEFSGFNVILHKRRGTDRDLTVRYGVNLLDFNDQTDYTNTYTACVPFWKGNVDGQDVVVVGDRVDSGFASYNSRNDCVPLDLSDKFETRPTKAQVEAKAASMMNANDTNLPAQTINVDFVRLQDLGYEDLGALLTCNLCDTIEVVFPRYNMSGRFKIVKTVFNVLTGKYDKMELGHLSTTLAEALGISNSAETLNTIKDLGLSGDLAVGGDASVVGDLTAGSVTVKNHAQRIGYMANELSETTAAIASSTTYSNTGKGFTLDPGTWVLVASVRFGAVNATGIRAAAWGASSVLNHTRSRMKPAGSGYVDDVITVALVQPSASTAFNVWVAQNSGDNTLTATITARAVRLE